MACRKRLRTSSKCPRSKPVRERGKNHLLIHSPDIVAGCYGDVLLNGQRLKHLLSLRIDIPADKEDQHFIKVTAEFMSSVRVEGNPCSIVADDRKVEFIL
jgi:hypothetical protein